MSSNTGQDVGFTSIYLYNPSRAAAGLFSALFFVSSVLHLTQLIKLKAYRITAILVWGCLMYTAGFVVREVSSFHQTDLGLYIASIVMLFCAPPVFAAVNYLVLGRTLHYVPYLSPIHPGRVVSTFIGLDCLVEVLTANGASRLAQYNNPSNVQLGANLLRGSLILQVALYVAFVALQNTFYRRCVKAGVASPNLRALMLTMYVSVGLITARSIYRVVDSFLGPTGYTENHEWCLYVFDATPLLINTFMLNLLHPALFLPKSNQIYLCQDGRTERKGPGFKDNRNFLVTLFDPFDVYGILTKRDSKDRFWEHEEEHALATADDKRAIALCSPPRPVWAHIVDPLNISGAVVKYGSDRASESNAKTFVPAV